MKGSIETTALPFDLVTLPSEEPGMLVTPSSDGSFAHVECAGGLVKFTVGGNGFVGTVATECGEPSEATTIDFNATEHGVQEHTELASTETSYQLKKGENNAALDMTVDITHDEVFTLECT